MKNLKMNTWSKVMGVGAIALISVAGCTGADQSGDGQTADSVPAAQMDQAGESVENAVDNAAAQTGDAVEGTVDAAGNAVDNAGDAVATGADKTMDAASNVDDAAMTPQIKTALGANASLEGSNIDVVTANNTVTLKGTVKNAAQKNAAETIAKREAPGYKIVNELTMS